MRGRLRHTRSPLKRLYLYSTIRRVQRISSVGLLTIEDGQVHAEIIPVRVDENVAIASSSSAEDGDAKGGEPLAWGLGCAPANPLPRTAAGAEVT